MIAEKAADLIKGRKIEPYEPDHGADNNEVVELSRARGSLRGAYSRAAQSTLAAPSGMRADKFNTTFAEHQQQHERSIPDANQQQHHHHHQNLDLNHNHHHHQFMHNKYDSSIMSEIIKKMV